MSAAPAVPVIDVTQLIPGGGVREGAIVLQQSVSYLPTSVHLAVVDPGVGTRRRPIALVVGGNVMVGPDNGLLLWGAEALGGVSVAYEITSPAVMLTPMSRTFHGRDLFAPTAAHLAAGLDPAELGPVIPSDELVRLPDPVASISPGTAEGEVLTVDRFGNVQTSLVVSELVGVLPIAAADTVLAITAGDLTTRLPFVETFASVSEGSLLAHEDSAGLLSLAVNRGDAAGHLGLAPGGRFTLRSAAPS